MTPDEERTHRSRPSASYLYVSAEASVLAAIPTANNTAATNVFIDDIALLQARGDAELSTTSRRSPRKCAQLNAIASIPD